MDYIDSDDASIFPHAKSVMVDRSTSPRVARPFVRSPYNYDMDEASLASGWVSAAPSLTKQAFADEVDINTIVHRFGLTGELPVAERHPMPDGDYSDVVDYRTALDMVMAAEAAFDDLPAKVRERFGNDPQRLLEFVQDEANRDEAVQLGVLPARVDPPAPEPMLVRVVPDSPTNE